MKHRGQEGRDEPIIEPDLRIIDAHHHLRIQPTQHYMLEDYLADIQSGHKITATVYLESRVFMKPDGPEALRPIGEIEYANGVGAMGASGFFGPERVCAAIIGYADMRLGDAVAAYFDRALEIAAERFRGVRQVTIEHPSEVPYRFIPHRPPSGVMKSPGFDLAFRHLARRGLTFDAAVFGHQLPEIIALADKYPDTGIILNHLGNPVLMEQDESERAVLVRQWAKDLRELARRQNVFCKVGGLGLPFWGFGFDTREQPASYVELATAWRPFVEVALQAFGPQRCMAESNFPPDGKSCGYVPYWNALKHLAKDYSSVEKAALFHGTAAKVYRIPMP